MTQSNKLLTIFFKKNNLNTMTQRTPTKNIIAEIEKWTGGPVPTLVWNGKWTTSWGKGNRFRFLGHPGQKYGVIFDWSDGRRELFYIEDFSGKIEIPKPPEIKDITDEFNALQNATHHPYALQKNITLPPGLKIKGSKLVVPLYSMDTHKIISWQEIFPQKDKDGKNKKFKANCPLTGGVYFMIGEKTEEVFACEGLATGVSIHKITKKRVFCCFTKHSLDNMCSHLLSNKSYTKVIMALDNDSIHTHKTKLNAKNSRLAMVIPDKKGDFNDYQDDILEKYKLYEQIKTEYQKKMEEEMTQKQIIDFIKKLKEAYYHYTDHSIPSKTQFFDSKKLIAKNHAILLAGGTESGKTGFSLSFLADRLKEGKKVIIWEHSEMNRINRLSQWIKDENLTNKPIITENRREIIEYIKKDNIILIDDTDSFFLMQRPTHRREVADTLEHISKVCQYAKCTIILCHYQTKASRSERDIKLRSGGDMSWINKMRYALIIEKCIQQGEKIDENGKKTLETYEKSYIYVQKGYKNEGRAYWLTKNFKPGEFIKKSTVEKILKKKTNPAVQDMTSTLNKLIFEKLEEKDRLEVNDLFKLTEEELGLTKPQTRNFLSLSNYKTKKEDFGKGCWIVVSKFDTKKPPEDKNKTPELPF